MTAVTKTFCVNCTHLLGKRHSPENAANWKCYHPSNIAYKSNDLVTGAEIVQLVCDDIVMARSSDDVCPAFQLYEPPTYNVAAQSIDSTSQITNLSRLAKLKTMRTMGVNDL